MSSKLKSAIKSDTKDLTTFVVPTTSDACENLSKLLRKKRYNFDRKQFSDVTGKILHDDAAQDALENRKIFKT